MEFTLLAVGGGSLRRRELRFLRRALPLLTCSMMRPASDGAPRSAGPVSTRGEAVRARRAAGDVPIPGRLPGGVAARARPGTGLGDACDGPCGPPLGRAWSSMPERALQRRGRSTALQGRL